METDRELPASEDAEIAVLGSILLDNMAFDEAASKLSAEDFAFDSHRRIFLRMEELIKAGQPINYVTLTDQLAKHKEIEICGGVARITSLSDLLPRVKHIGGYVKVVEEKAILRSMIHACTGTLNACYEAASPARTIAGYHDEALQKILSGKDEAGQHVAEFSDDLLTEIHADKAKGPGISGFSFGIDEVDVRTNGLRLKECAIVGGRAKDGKTAVALSATEANCKKKIPVGFASLEMNKEALLERVWCSVSHIHADKFIHRHLMEEEDLIRLHSVKEAVDEWPLYIDDDPDVTISQVCARARLWQRRYGIKLFVLDYMQLLMGPGDERSRMIKASRALRLLAKQQNTAVIALSQLTRPEGKNENRPPTKFDLKESGSLEADFHKILLIFRPKYVGGEDDNPAEPGFPNGKRARLHTQMDEIIIEQRRGAPGIAPVTYVGPWLQFCNRDLRGYFGFTS